LLPYCALMTLSVDNPFASRCKVGGAKAASLSQPGLKQYDECVYCNSNLYNTRGGPHQVFPMFSVRQEQCHIWMGPNRGWMCVSGAHVTACEKCCNWMGSNTGSTSPCIFEMALYFSLANIMRGRIWLPYSGGTVLLAVILTQLESRAKQNNSRCVEGYTVNSIKHYLNMIAVFCPQPSGLLSARSRGPPERHN